MKFANTVFTIALILCLSSLIISCSKSSSPMNPQIPSGEASEYSLLDNSEVREITAVYNATIDTVNQTFTVEPENRSPMFHFPLSRYYPNVLKIVGYGFTPNFWADIRLSHPFPGSGIDGFDPRIIAIVPANDGVSCFYPVFNVLANNKALMNPDAYTLLWDSLGGSIVGNANPFKAYFKNQPYRRWSSIGSTQDTQRWNINLAGFGGPVTFKLVVDVCSNFPSAPQPVIDNAPEPVDISCSIGSGMTNKGGNAPINVTFLDWQGSNNIKCKIEAPDLFDSAIQLFYLAPGPNPNEYVFSGTIPNDKLARAGEYNVLIAAWDIPTDVHIYKEAVAVVENEWGAWHPDPNRTNVDLSVLSYYPPKPGSDLGVIDCDDSSINGVLMYEETDMVVRMNLDLTTCEIYGDAYLPQDGDPDNPHPNPDIFPAGRIDATNNGVAVRSFIDGHYGAGPDLHGHYQREDSIILIERPDAGFLNFVIAAMPNMSDIPSTPLWDEEDERPRVTDVYEEYDTGEGKYVVSGIWSGTVISYDPGGGVPFYPIGVMGGIKEPYYDEPFIKMDWGLWIFAGPPTNEIKGADASQDSTYPYQYWGYSGDYIGNSVIGVYDKDGGTVDAIVTSDPDAKLLDIELIPIQDPPLEINGIRQFQDWIAVLLDNKTIEIMDPFAYHGQSVEIIDVSLLIGDVYYLDIADRSGDIFISHSDGPKQYCSVFTLN